MMTSKTETPEPAQDARIAVGAPDAATAKALAFCESHLRESLVDLKRLVEIPSVSLEGFDPAQMQLSAEATADLLRRSGMDKVEVLQFGQVHPYVYAEWLEKPGAPTLLLYAHHDVQPPGRESSWKSAPFKPTEKGGRLYGRGAADDKAGILAHAAAVAAFLKTTGELPVNVKILIEGEEEIGSGNLGEFVRRYREKLKADGMILTDCANIETGIPSITTSLRGLVALDIELHSLDHPVHSGLWGGILPDPVSALAGILGTLVDPAGHILVPELTQGVRPLGAEERALLERLRMEEIARSATGLLPGSQFSVPEARFAEHLWHQPSLSINAIQAGSRERVSNIIQDGAWARVSIRIVPDMQPEKVLAALEAHIRKVCPPGFRLSLQAEAAGKWWRNDPRHEPVLKLAARSLEKAYGAPAQFIGCGASIPFVQPLSEELGGIPAILVGVEDPYTNAHAENESLHLEDFRKTLLGQIHMLADLAHYKRA